MNWVQKWRINRLERYLSETKADLAEWRRAEQMSDSLWPTITVRRVVRIAHLETTLAQCKKDYV